jgi:AcrR family transcriptional regulator
MDDDVLLDAARDCVLSVGVRRTTLTDIAKRAGTSRMTVYRRFPGVTSVVAALMTREFGALLTQVDRTADSARERLVANSVSAVRSLIDNPLLRSVLDRDADLLLPYLVQRIGGTQRLAETFVADQLAAGHADGSIRAAPVVAQTRVFFLTLQSFVISHRSATQGTTTDELLAELASSLEHSLRPESP